jgi:hypothetical protein
MDFQGKEGWIGEMDELILRDESGMGIFIVCKTYPKVY